MLASASPESTSPDVGVLPSSTRLTWPAAIDRLPALSTAVGSSVAPAVESSVTPLPVIVAPAPMFNDGTLDEFTPARTTCADASLVTRSSAPSPLPAVPALPSNSVCAGLDSDPACSITAPASTVSESFATKITSGPVNASPALFTVKSAVVTVTCVPAVPDVR